MVCALTLPELEKMVFGFGKMISILYRTWSDNEFFLGMNEVTIYRAENYLSDTSILAF